MRSLFIVFTLLACAVQAQDNRYESAILKGKKLIAEADGEEAYRSASNFFERIAQKETERWLPLYFQAQSLAFLGADLSDPTKKDEVLNNALELVKKARTLENNVETVALEGFIQMIRLTVDPATRGQTLSPEIFSLFIEALKMDSENPRALLFMGQMQYGTAQFFGSGVEEACKYIQNAYDIFEQQPDEETINPDWGAKSAGSMLQKCNGSN